tara:strand:- start:269 stop:553 length:285 start_codon:yes stop_codon:yes gene_type:complete
MGELILINNHIVFNCRVCGLGYTYNPWGDDGNSPDYSYCDCCNVEFGYQDYSIESTINFRNKWIKNGAVWSETSEQPKNWNLEAQLKNIPVEYQ